MKKVVVVLTMMFGLVAMTGKVDAAKKVAPVQTIKTTKVNQTQQNGDGTLTLRSVKVEKVNKVNDKTKTDAEYNLAKIKAPYYRVTYNVQLINNDTFKANLSDGTWTLTINGEARSEINGNGIFTDIHVGTLNPGAKIKSNFVYLSKEKPTAILPATFDYDGFYPNTMNTDDEATFTAQPLSFTFNK